MRKIILTFIILSVLSCKAQIIPVQEHLNHINNEIEIPDNSYIKDVDNILDKYTGTWSGDFNNKHYTFVVEKYTRHSDIRPLKIDELRMRYKIIDISTGSILADTTNLLGNNIYVMRGLYPSSYGTYYVLNYAGLNSECGQNGNVYISPFGPNFNKLQLFLIVEGGISEDCTVGGGVQVLPVEEAIFDKQ